MSFLNFSIFFGALRRVFLNLVLVAVWDVRPSLKIEGGTGGNIFTHSLCDAAHVFSWVNLGVCVVLFASYGPA